MIKNKETSLWKIYAIRLSVMLLLLAISRWLLYVFNAGNFPDITVADQFRLFFVGMRFDLWTLVVANIPILIGYSLPFKFKYNKLYCKITDILFGVLNWFAVALNLVNVIYYRYIDKWMTSELTEFFMETDDNQGSMMMHFIHDFWFIVLFMIVTALIIIVLTKKTQLKKEVIYNNKMWYISRTFMFLFIIFWSVIAMRGGFQLRPTEIITAEKLNEMPKPFAAGIFTLSSHHPFTIPQGYTVPEGNYKSEFEKTVRYADDALRLFIGEISQYSWYDSTIFVITGDHVNPEHYFEKYRNGYGQYQMPFAFYSPNKINALRTNIMAQQTDIGASLMAALGYDEPFFSFGRNVFDSIQEPCFSSFVNEVYQYSDGRYMLQSDGESIIRVYDLENDKELKNNLYSKENSGEWDGLEAKFHLLLQQYNNRMISNKLYVK